MDFAGQRRTVARVKTRFVSWNVALSYPGSSLLAVVEARQAGRAPAFRRTPPPPGVMLNPFAAKVDMVKPSRVPPAVRPDPGRGYCGPKGTILFSWAKQCSEGGPPFWGGPVNRYPLCKNLEIFRMLDHGASCLKMLPQNFQTFTMTGLEQEVSALRLPSLTGSRSLLRDSNFP